MGTDINVRLDPLFLRHDLMIELGRLDMAIDRAQLGESAAAALADLQTRRAHLNEALSRLPA